MSNTQFPMETTIYNQKGEVAGKTTLPKELFGTDINPDLVYQVAVTQMANRRQGTAHTKNRGEVSGGGKKPWRQKGTGRSRHGSTRSPIWRHGGVVFGPRKEKIYGGKINKKMRRKALAMVLSAKARGNFLILLDNLAVGQPKTKEMVEILTHLRKNVPHFQKGSVMVALPGLERNIVLASRNIPEIDTIEAAKLNVLDLLNAKYLIMPLEAIGVIPRLTVATDETVFAGKKKPGAAAKKPARKTKTGK